MSRCAEIALRAVNYRRLGIPTYKEAWEMASKEVTEEWAYRKETHFSPRNTFLAIFGEGDVKENAEYAKEALRILRKDPDATFTTRQLWKKVMQELIYKGVIEKEKAYNEQMDVVLALWNAKLIPEEGDAK